MKYFKVIFFFLLITGAQLFGQESLQKLKSVDFSLVNVTDPFWKERMDRVATKTIDACIMYTENKTGRIRNFEKAAKRSGEHEGIYYDDSDVYKALEAIAYSLKNHPDAALEKKADEWIDKIAAAQLPDGYLNTYYTLTGLNNRWTDMERHEDYCAGHLIEAGIAYHSTTGKRKLLDVAIRFANHIDSTFRLPNRHWVSGHQEIELALMRLYHHTNETRYLELAKWFLDQRGHGYGKGKIWDQWNDPAYCQDEVPIKDQKEITGHAVRAMYMYTGVADVAAVTNDPGYVTAMKTIWEDVIGRNMYITGGIGSQGKNEGFGEDYDLPNESAYCETCASVGMVFWNQRMNMLTGEAQFTDILERSLYNGALDGLSLTGDRFFYGNPLASQANHQRSEWFGTACCPSNIARLVSSIGNYIYSYSDNSIWINLFIGSEVQVPLKSGNMGISIKSGYPWKGNNTIEILTSKRATINIRIPGWLKEPAAEGLYKYTDAANVKPVVTLNGKPVSYKEEKGYAVISRSWKKGDIIQFETPMQVREIVSRPELKQNEGRIALQYGPMVYCVEGVDNNKSAFNFVVGEKPAYAVEFNPGLLNGINTIKFNANTVEVAADGRSVNTVKKQITAVPYYSWNNRGADEMQVWLPVNISKVQVAP